MMRVVDAARHGRAQLAPGRRHPRRRGVHPVRLRRGGGQHADQSRRSIRSARSRNSNSAPRKWKTRARAWKRRSSLDPCKAARLAGDAAGQETTHEQSEWRRLRGVDQGALREARLQAHYAAQWLARLARAYVAPQPDDGHTSLGWDDALDGFTTHPSSNGTRLSLKIADLTLVGARRQISFPQRAHRRRRSGNGWASELVCARPRSGGARCAVALRHARACASRTALAMTPPVRRMACLSLRPGTPMRICRSAASERK